MSAVKRKGGKYDGIKKRRKEGIEFVELDKRAYDIAL